MKANSIRGSLTALPRAIALRILAVFLLLFCLGLLANLARGIQTEPETATIVLNVNVTKDRTSPMLLGGNEVLASSYTIEAAGRYLRAFPGHSWRIFVNDDTSGWRWDTNEGVPGHGASKFSSGLLSTEAFISGGNSFSIDPWNNTYATDLSRFATVTKIKGAPDARLRLFQNDSGQPVPAYIRFDLGISSDVPFDGPGEWVVFAAYKESWQKLVVAVSVKPDRRIVLFTSQDLASGPTSLASPFSLHLDKMYSFEVAVLSDRIELYVDHALVGTLSGQYAYLARLLIGCIASPDAVGKIYIDAARFDSSYIGKNVKLPWEHQYLSHITFDHGRRTIDDIARLMEKIGGTAVWVIPLPRYPDAPDSVKAAPGHGYAWQTPQFYADMVEYLNGVADPDYERKAKTLDFSHQTPRDNWANLRAARGRIKSYNEVYFEMGNEPYVGGGWRIKPADIEGYADKVVEYARAIKAVDPNVKLGICVFNNLEGSKHWIDIVLPIAKDWVDWLSVAHYYPKPPGTTLDQTRPWWLGLPVARDSQWKHFSGRKMGYTDYFFDPDLAHNRITRYMPERKDEIFIGITEFGYQLTYSPGSGNWLGDAINRASWVGVAGEKRLKMAHAWTLVGEAGHVNNLIGIHKDGHVELTPSYYAYQLWSKFMGSNLIEIGVRGPTYQVSYSGGFTIDYLSAWATLSDDKSILRLLVINRHEQSTIPTKIRILGFQPNSEARVWQLGGNGYTVYSSNAKDPNHVVPRTSTFRGISSSFDYKFEPLSITVIEGKDTSDSQENSTPPARPRKLRILSE